MGGSTIYIGSDHRGFELKNDVRDFLKQEGYNVEDVGAHEYDKHDDYIDYATKACAKVRKNNAKGILICGAGQGMTIAANKHKGIRAAQCWNVDTAKRAKMHVDANVICISADFTPNESARQMVSAWLGSRFLKKSRYVRRIDALNRM